MTTKNPGTCCSATRTAKPTRAWSAVTWSTAPRCAASTPRRIPTPTRSGHISVRRGATGAIGGEALRDRYCSFTTGGSGHRTWFAPTALHGSPRHTERHQKAPGGGNETSDDQAASQRFERRNLLIDSTSDRQAAFLPGQRGNCVDQLSRNRTKGKKCTGK